MGYRSDFNIDVFPEDKLETILTALERASGYTFEGPYLYDSKWFRAEEDLTKVSALHPGVRISVYVTGEDGEQWILNALDGVVINRAGTVIFKPNTLWEEDAA